MVVTSVTRMDTEDVPAVVDDSGTLSATVSKAATLAPNFQRTVKQWTTGLIGIKNHYGGELIGCFSVTGDGLSAA